MRGKKRLFLSLFVVCMLLSVALTSGVALVGMAKKPGGDPPPPPADPAIAYIKASTKKEPGGIAVMNADGERQTAIFSGDGPFSNPTWSPDGSSIAFRRYQTPFWSIWAIDVDVVDDEPQGSNPRQLADPTACGGDYCWYPEWSPDGENIAVHTKWYAENNGIYLIPAEGLPEGEMAEMVFDPLEGDSVGYVTWKSDSTQLAFWYSDRSGEEPVRSIIILDLTTRPAQVVKNLFYGEFTSMREMSWARTGNKLAFVAEPSGGGTKSLYILDIDAETYTAVTEGLNSACWSPDDAEIVFQRQVLVNPQRTESRISVIDMATGEVSDISDTGWHPDWIR